MKNFKKILIALLIVAVLAAALAVVIGAEDVLYTGRFKEFYDRYVEVEAAANASKAPEEQSEKVKAAYDYLLLRPVNPDSTLILDEGKETEREIFFTDIKASLDAHVIRVAGLLIEGIGSDVAEDMAKVDNVVAYLAACPIDGLEDVYAALWAKNDAVVKAYYEEISKPSETAPEYKEIYGIIENIITLYEHLDKYPLVEGVDENAALLEDITAYAHKTAVLTYGIVEAIPTACTAKEGGTTCKYCDNAVCAHVDENTQDGFCDLCDKNYAAATCEHANEDGDVFCDKCHTYYIRDHYLDRYNGILVVDRLITICDVSSVDGVGEESILNKIEAYLADMKSEYNAKRAYVDSLASFDEYDISSLYVHEKFGGEGTVNIGMTTSPKTWNNPNTDEGKYSEIINDIYGNKYYNLHYGPGSCHLYVEPQWDDRFLPGMVVDFDMILDENFTGIDFVTREASVGMGTPFYLRVSDGEVTVSNKVSDAAPECPVKVQKTVPGVIQMNVWTHYTLTFNEETKSGELYVNYEKVLDIAYTKFEFESIRIGTANANQCVGLDNFEFFNGTAYRIFDKFSSDNMSDRDRFEYYVDYFLDERNTALNRNVAYTKATRLVDQFRAETGEETDEYVLKYDACDYRNDIRNPAMEKNIELLIKEIGKLVEVAQTLSTETTGDVRSAIDTVNAFVKKNGALINKGDARYQEQMMLVYEIQDKLAKVENIEAFIKAVSNFKRATGYDMMVKYAQVAERVYNSAGYGEPENYDLVAKDPLAVAFVDALNGKLTPEEEGYYVDIFQYYNELPAKIAARANIENSKRFNDCIRFITSLEGYELTEAFMTANEEFIAKYMDIARDVLLSGEYDATVAGFDASLEIFDDLNNYFYKALQNKHITFLSTQLAKYEGTESIIDKMGVVAVVRQYLDTEDVAIYNENMSKELRSYIAEELEQLEYLVVVCEVYEEEIELQKQDYPAVLEQNTQYFISTIAEMDTLVSYAELRPLFDLATSYFYNINVDSEESKAAIEKYVAYRESIEKMETNGALFVGYVRDLNYVDDLAGVAKQDEIYSILVQCMQTYAETDITVTGVKSAYDTYQAALAEYNGETEIVNSDIAEAGAITCAVRSDYIAATVLAIIGKIFGY